ncbi:SETMAR [Cordylochernes scorpioides]|uniref:SETMAR n=1 Tax=Cordylochernes scorpioides TaxID=51811 RepID=A0ABY6K6T1_9ARAC|nr:SETMAR [Cordylochernes scorpioides]
MVISESKSAHLREVLLFAFNWKKGATEAHRMLEEVHGDHALSKSQCYRWFKKFQSGDFELDNEPRGKPHQKFEDAELQALLDDDSTQTQEKLAKQLQQERRLVTCEGLLARHEKKSFLHRIVTSDEKSIHFSNPMRQKSWGLLGQFPKRKPRPNRLGKKAMLYVWWNQTGVVYFKLLKPGETVNTSRYEQQMHSLREALNEKRPELREKHNKLILQHDNAPALNATVVKNTIKDLGWELLPHPPYSPDLAPSDYHLFTSLGHALKSQEFSNSDILRKWLVDCKLLTHYTCPHLNSVVTGDESWMFKYDPESKRQSCAWYTKSSPRLKKARMSKSCIKTMIIVFFDIRGIVHCEFVPQGQTVNSAIYLEVLRRSHACGLTLKTRSSSTMTMPPATQPSSLPTSWPGATPR